MNSRGSATTYYRSIIIASMLLGGSLLASLSVLADQNSPTPGTILENQATAQFTDAVDGTDGTIVSDKVSVTVAEVAGIAASNVGVLPSANGGAYRTNTVYFDFYVTNTGNDPTRLFVPGAPSVATIAGVNLAAANIGTVQVIAYNASPIGSGTEVTITSGNNVPAAGVATGTGTLTLTAASGAPVAGSIPAGGYIKVRVPITVPLTAAKNEVIGVTLGNAVGQPDPAASPAANFIAGQTATNIPYVNGGNDLYTQDNPDSNEVSAGAPVNGVREASTTLTTPVIDPPIVTINGTVWDDANGSGTNTFTGIQTGTEAGAVTTGSTPALKAILVGSDGKVLDAQPVNPATGGYSVSTLGVQSGVHVILVTSTTAYAKGDIAPTTGSLPPNWAGTTPLDYKGTPDSSFPIGITTVSGKDFGIDRLPTANNVSTGPVTTPSGTNTTVVPTLTGSDPEDTSIAKYHILTLPDAATQGTLYYSGAAVTPAQITAGFYVADPALFTFDPVDTATVMTFTYASVDKAAKESLVGATATISYNAAPVTIGGTIWNDKNNSANNTFIGINDPGESGTNAVFGTTTTAIDAVLVNTTTGKVIGSQAVPASGVYSFTSVPANTNVQVFLSATLPAISDPAPTIGTIPTGWVKTSPLQTASFNTGLLPSTKDFGIRQKAKFVLVKRITKINGFTTNPNDGTVLTGTSSDTTDTNNPGVTNWPAHYLDGKISAGVVKPSDTIEYTIYFLNNQGADASGIKICDPIRGTQDYVPGSLKLNLSGTGNVTSDVGLTDIVDPTVDRANSYTKTDPLPTGCNIDAATSSGTDNNGGVAIEVTGTTGIPALTAIPGATATPATPPSYGLFRFTTQVKP
jgi:hypothetical protein